MQTFMFIVSMSNTCKLSFMYVWEREKMRFGESKTPANQSKTVRLRYSTNILHILWLLVRLPGIIFSYRMIK